ncbi:MAG: hypothetical protein IT430_09055 [Phycisphaerales bacterium]|nr:hypothetical protein [Phycisphaerales bacterium]
MLKQHSISDLDQRRSTSLEDLSEDDLDWLSAATPGANRDVALRVL